MTEQRLTVAILGCGQAAAMHARTLRSLGGVALRFASRDDTRAAVFAGRHGGTPVAGGYGAAVAAPGVDAVLVCTPPHLHLEWTLAALAAGRDVIVEKPAFPTAADAVQAAGAAEAAGRRVLVAENYAYKPLLRRLRGLLAEGAIGAPRQLYVNAMKPQDTGGWRDDPAVSGGGALLEGGIHWVAFMAELGMAVREVAAWRPGQGKGLERAMHVVFAYEGGAVGTLLFSWQAPSPLKGVRLSRIYGTEGALAFESNGVLLSVWGRKRRLLLPGLRDIAGYRAMFRDFLRALRTGAGPAYSLASATRDLRLVEAAYASATARDGAAAE